MSDSKQQIRRFIVENFLFGQDAGLADDTSFLDEGFMDSTGVLELVAFLEKTHGIKVDEDEITPDNLDSIDAIHAYILRKHGSAGVRSNAGNPPAIEPQTPGN